MPSKAVATSRPSAQPIGITPRASAPRGAAATSVRLCKDWFSPAARTRKPPGTSMVTLAAAAGAWKACAALRIAIIA